MKYLRLYLMAFIAVLLTACQTTGQGLDQSFWKNKKQPVHVVTTSQPAPRVYTLTRSGLANMMDNSLATHKMNHFLETSNAHAQKSFATVRPQFVERLRGKGLNAVVANSVIDISGLPKTHFVNSAHTTATKDYRLLARKFGTNRLLVLSVKKLGAFRGFDGTVGHNVPQAFVKAEGKLVDLKTNRVLWTQSVDKRIRVQEPWNQPPLYKNLTVALDQAVDTAKAALMESFFAQ